MNAKKTLSPWPILFLIGLIGLLYIINPISRYFYTKDFIRNRDLQLAQMLAHDFETNNISSFDKPIFFVGSSETITNDSCLDLSKGNISLYSVFAAADTLDLDTVESSQYIVDYLNQLGYSYTAPTKQDWELYQDEILEQTPLWKSFPWYDAILETEHCIIVQLS